MVSHCGNFSSTSCKIASEIFSNYFSSLSILCESTIFSWLLIYVGIKLSHEASNPRRSYLARWGARIKFKRRCGFVIKTLTDRLVIAFCNCSVSTASFMEALNIDSSVLSLKAFKVDLLRSDRPDLTPTLNSAVVLDRLYSKKGLSKLYWLELAIFSALLLVWMFSWFFKRWL